MKTALIAYDDMSAFDFTALYAVFREVPAAEIEICGLTSPVTAAGGLSVLPGQTGQSLQAYDLLLVPGGDAAAHRAQDSEFTTWLRSAEGVPMKAACGDGVLLLVSAGMLDQGLAGTQTGEEVLLLVNGSDPQADRVQRFPSPRELGRRLARGPLEAQAAAPSTHHTSGSAPRSARVERQTSETRVRIELNLDGTGHHRIATGVGFLDHMLTHVAVHGLFDLDLQASGDLHIDVHHTVEDVALALGQAFNQALGDRSGITRMAHACAPMDETLAFAAVDLSGRPYAVIDAQWDTPAVGGIPTSLFAHFFESFAVTARCNLHARLLAGRDDHHRAEALFKAFARALDQASCLDPRRSAAGGLAIPSTKGTLTA